jgi:hypothetical protein
VDTVTLTVLASGVDSLYVSAKGTVRPALWPVLELVKGAAHEAGEAEMFEWPVTGRTMAMKPHGVRTYGFWLSSPDFELMLSTNERFPPAMVQLHSAFLHSVGVDAAIDAAASVLIDDVFAWPPELNVSRIDLYADVQGWDLELGHLPRFVSLGRARRGFGQVEEFTSGHRLTGFRFGAGGALMVRVYDKTVEIGRRGLAWLPDLWGERRSDESVWRIEAQFKRAALVDFNPPLRTVDEVLSRLQALWRYVTGEWLTYREPSDHQREARWPLDPIWREVQAIELAPSSVDLVRGRLAQAEELRLVQGGLGYLTSWAALRNHHEIDSTLEAIRPILVRYLESRGSTFRDEVKRKRDRRLEVSDPGEESAA